MNKAKPAHLLCIGSGWFPKQPGGLERYLYELTYYLAVAGDRVEFCGVGLPETEPNFPVKLTNLASPTSPLWQRLWSTRVNFCQRQAVETDAINLHFALYSLPLLKYLPHEVPITFTFHGPWSLESQKEGAGKISLFMKTWIEQRVYERCNRFIVLSQAFGKILHKKYQVPAEKIHVIPGGINTARFQMNLSRQQARNQLNWPQTHFILFSPRRLIHRTGLPQLLNAIATIKPHIREVWLAIAGQGPLKSALQQQVKELEIDRQVRLLGFLPDDQLPVAYQAADLTVVPSQSLEGFGLILLESLSCGTPVLCTPVGGMPEVLEPFFPNLIAKSPSPKDMAQLLKDLLLGKSPIPSRTACRNYATTHFHWPKIAQQVRQILLTRS